MVQWLRSLLFFTMFCVGIFFYGVLITLVWPITPLTFRRWLAKQWAYYNLFMLKWVCGLKHVVSGQENLPPAPFVILSKHQSEWETVTFHTLFPFFAFALKRSLKWIPIFGWALAATQQIFINRSHGTEALRLLATEGKAAMAQGDCILIFPEGTRMPAGQVGDYKPGGVMLAMAAEAPIVPVAHDAGYYWPKGQLLKKAGTVRVKIGKPIPTAGLPKNARKQLMAQVEQSIEGMIEEIRAEREAEGSITPNPPG
ncbi:1-acyl-sn-glycerol-3-phosphate acyltransferase [Magnetococcus marinus MC-1]|uniref:1-acyl-sn-glycerol-3-phosphate acyltransferase n=1 Tax=Magnetococcus marinus (strain ATCC BAA-1437 / JCM 17883 / MC-1) TaxID=156889 RepID=A0LA31_MAGMM|nr:lysophospholipid acyltransferase family protein [Magnetococcus marinus]ABK44824.1 1-acyl-sn-glycerol-3-phosphate acyltransferase [Magnetococcus marinus MC-1]